MNENIDANSCRPGACIGDIKDPRLKLAALQKRLEHLRAEKELIDDKIYLIEHDISILKVGIPVEKPIKKSTGMLYCHSTRDGQTAEFSECRNPPAGKNFMNTRIATDMEKKDYENHT